MCLEKFKNVDCMEFFKKLENNSVDLILTDIPFGGVNDFKDNERKRFANRFQSLENADIVTFDIEEYLKDNEIELENWQPSDIEEFFEQYGIEVY